MQVYLCCLGRWDSTGEELFKLTDRHGDKYCLGPVSLLFDHLPIEIVCSLSLCVKFSGIVKETCLC